MKFLNKYWLWLIIILSILLRFLNLGGFPALNADEAALGYNAFSLIETGMDEHGNSWPVHLQSFNDFKPALYVYLLLPLVKLFGLSEFVVRLPGALAGVATVWTLYFLVKELFRKMDLPFSAHHLALTSAFLLAISPWHIHFSRGAWEVNVATFLITLGVYFFVKATQKPKLFIYSAAGFALSLYAYHAARVIVPLLGLGLFAIYFFDIKKNLKSLILPAILGVILLVPLGADLANGSVFSRAAGVGLFADPGPLSRVEEQRTEHADFRSLLAKVFHNKPINYTLAFFDNWSEHFWGEFLFLSGDDIQRSKVPETGQMYMFEIVTVVVGLGALITGIKRRGNRLVLFWLLVAPTAAALTFQSPHALRAQNMVIPLTISSALGVVAIVSWLGTVTKRRFSLWRLAFGIIVLWSFVRYERMYWLHMPKEYPFSSQYGVAELVDYLEKNAGGKKVVVTDRYDQPYILFLFYTQYDPVKFQQEGILTRPDGYGFSTVRDFANYRFESIKFEEMKSIYPSSLIVGTDEEIPDEANVVKEIVVNDYKYFQVVAN